MATARSPTGADSCTRRARSVATAATNAWVRWQRRCRNDAKQSRNRASSGVGGLRFLLGGGWQATMMAVTLGAARGDWGRHVLLVRTQ